MSGHKPYFCNDEKGDNNGIVFLLFEYNFNLLIIN